MARTPDKMYRPEISGPKGRPMKPAIKPKPITGLIKPKPAKPTRIAKTIRKKVI
jgi:hypothetical protein